MIDEWTEYSSLFHAHPRYIEELYQQYRQRPELVEPQWRAFFAGYDLAGRDRAEAVPAEQPPAARTADGPPAVHPLDSKEFRVMNLITTYRTRGHLFTKTNPVRTRRTYRPTLDLANFGLTPADLETVFQAGAVTGPGPAPLRDIIARLDETYCASLGAEYMYIRIPERVEWLQRRMESTRNRPDFNPEQKRSIFQNLLKAVTFENFFHSRYPGQKRFSLAGGESLIPGLVAVLENGARLGLEEFVFGMAHRGRLNVLANVLGKPSADIFEEFEGHIVEEDSQLGDVKYHLGFSNTLKTGTGSEIKLNLLPNPSHLETVGPVVEGFARALQDHRYAGAMGRLAPVLIHGDAALAGQGVVYEVTQMSLLDAFRTGGTIHLVINNQLGFTTNYLDGRSSTYCTDVAKVTLSPVFHVNADDVEAVVQAVQLALEYRQTFHTDVFIDLLGYRRYGHNESDEPRFTQPKLYQIIAAHPDPAEIYAKRLEEAHILAAGEADRLENAIRAALQIDFKKAREEAAPHCHFQAGCGRRNRPARERFIQPVSTGVPVETLLRLGRRVYELPEKLPVLDKIRRIYSDWLRNLLEKGICDWSTGETLAYASLLAEGVDIRISGQDCERGTFSHRHAVVLLENTEEEYVPLNHIAERQGQFRIYNSLLSEYAVLGFEYGYNDGHPLGLGIWEAQFGDFTNGAQIIIDQYLSSAEAKWSRLNGLVLYLPHGYEGQGADHSSARPERFLSLCAQSNMQVANCTTPANFFHLLRRQASFPVKIPLVIFTPKSLLRHPACISRLEEFSAGGFQPVLDDPEADPAHVRRVLLCSGKLYYDLWQRRRELNLASTALVRLEQLYPVPAELLPPLVRRYGTASWHWVQEEPRNQGAGLFIKDQLPFLDLEIIARPESAAAATGLHALHHMELNALLQQAFPS